MASMNHKVKETNLFVTEWVFVPWEHYGDSWGLASE